MKIQILFLILIIRSVSQRQRFRFRLVRGRVEVEGTQVAAPEYRIVPSSVTTSSTLVVLVVPIVV